MCNTREIKHHKKDSVQYMKNVIQDYEVMLCEYCESGRKAWTNKCSICT